MEFYGLSHKCNCVYHSKCPGCRLTKCLKKLKRERSAVWTCEKCIPIYEKNNTKISK